MRNGGLKTALRFVLPVAAAVLFVSTPGPTSAQVTRSDSAAVLLDAAARLERDGRRDAARELYVMIVARFSGTPAADSALQTLGGPRGTGSTRGGRVELQVWSTVYGLWLGVAVPAAFGADGSEPYGIGLLIGGPAGFLTGLVLARSRELTDGQARAITWGGTWGSWQGFGWAEVLDLGEGPDCFGDVCVSDGGPEERFAGMIVGGLTGIGVGLAFSGRNITNGMATSFSLGSLWGSWFGLAGGVLAGLEDDDLVASTLLLGDAGLFTSALIASQTGMSRDRARLISIAGVIGGLAGGGVDLIAKPDDDKELVAIPFLGSLAGLVIGAVTTRGFDGQDSSGGDLDDALLRFDGDWRVGVPVPSLASVPARARGRDVRRPALGLTLFRARF